METPPTLVNCPRGCLGQEPSSGQQGWLPVLLPFPLGTLPAGWEEEGGAWRAWGVEEKARLESCLDGVVAGLTLTLTLTALPACWPHIPGPGPGFPPCIHKANSTSAGA